ncbi:hypothetical protein EII20_11845 [Comamonadaceae bacterium OH2545_COT-014]|nr:hypothetical protein EII20_11845 [Comamonadaceae bacterium OH2545_COT-014]
MPLFPHGHATHPQWQMAASLVLAQLRAQMALPGYASAPTLGLIYITGHYAPHAQALLAWLAEALPGVQGWAGATGAGVAASNAEYLDEPALAVMLCDVPAGQWRVFSGVAPLGGRVGQAPATALVHADAQTPDLPELIAELAEYTASGCLFGGLTMAGRGPAAQAVHGAQALQLAATRAAGDHAASGAGRLQGGVFGGGLSGVAFGAGVPLMSRLAQGCQPVAGEHAITEAEGNLLLTLDGEPALDVMLDDLAIRIDLPHAALTTVRQTLVGLSDAEGGRPPLAGARRHLGDDVRVRHIIGIDPARRGIAIADAATPGQRMVFCQRSAQAARADLMRVCAEIREALEPQHLAADTAAALATPPALSAPHPARRIAGAVYVSCASRGGPHFGHPGAELQTVRHALGDVPLVGFFAGGEIARRHLYGYCGVLTVFVDEGAGGG